MNLNKFMFASMILGGLSACSKDDVVSNDNGNGGEVEGAAYMSLSIAMPSANGSRANGNDNIDEGTAEEQKISNLAIYIWSKDESKLTFKLIDGKDLRPNKPNDPATPDKSTVYTTDAIPVDKGAHKIAVIANGNSIELQKILLPSQLRKAQTLEATVISSISTKNNFLMTNANTATTQNQSGSQLTVSTETKENGKFYEDGTVAVDVQGTKARPTSVTVPIERAVAKIEDRTNSYTFDVIGSDIQWPNKKDQVIFTEMTLVNGNTKIFLVKQIRPINSTPATTEDFRTDESKFYVVDPNFEKQSDSKDFMFNKFQWSETENTALDVFNWKKLSNEKRPCFYALENTMTASEQKNAYTTGLYYKATYKVNGATEGDNVYKFQGKVYSYAQLATLPDLQLNDLKDTDTADKFNAIGVTKFEKGVCYYPYWIRHINNSKENLAPMEFGVVRNNYYQMTINSVNGIGTPEPENPDPSTPDEDPETMLEVMVKVMPWTVRHNGIDF